MKTIRNRILWAIPIVVCIACGFLLLRGCGGRKPRNVWADAARAAREKLLKEGVGLAIAGSVSREDLPGSAQSGRGETRPSIMPVTSGLPLPDGAVEDVAQLRLVKGGKPVPCQFTALGRWPAKERNDGMVEGWNNGAVKWVLLDFLAEAGETGYMLRVGGGNADPEVPVRAEAGDAGMILENRHLRIGISTNRPGIIHSVFVDGIERIAPGNPVRAVLTDDDGTVYRSSKPKKVTVEAEGPIRAAVLVQGEFLSKDGRSLMGGKVKYDARITLYADQPDVRIAFTLKNHGEYYGKKPGPDVPDKRCRQWLYFKALRIDVPVSGEGSGVGKAFLGSQEFKLESKRSCSAAQWYKYPYQDRRDITHGQFEDEKAVEDAYGMGEVYEGFYWRGDEKEKSVGVWVYGGVGAERKDGRKPRGGPGKLAGWAEVRGDKGEMLVGMAVRKFWQNFPSGFAVEPGKLSYLILPEGGFWPRSKEAHDARTYQFEGGRHKTWEFAVWFGGPAGGEKTAQREAGGFGETALPYVARGEEMERRLNEPPFVRASVEWYRDTGAVWPLALAHLQSDKSDISDLSEALGRYDRLQRAKVNLECGDSAGPEWPSKRDWWGKVSIPDLQDRCADVFSGWMNYGDLVWSFGYCSLYYDWPYSMLTHYLRLGDRELLDVAEDMARHRYDIDQWYHGEGRGGWQRYEKGEHGHNELVDPLVKRWADSGHPSHTWNRGLLLYWALRDDQRALDAAVANGQAYYEFWYEGRKLGETNKVEYTEFRTPVWTMENWLALYEYTGEKKYLDWANEVFDKTLLAMERDNGRCGHILKEGHQGAQFTAYMVEPVCRLHHITGRKDVLEFLKRVLDWQRREGIIGGIEKDGKQYPVMWVNDWGELPSLEKISLYASHRYSILFCDGYAYLGEVLGRRKDNEFARRLFTEFMFHYCCEFRKEARTPLGYHVSGSPFGFTPKIHAFTGRYGQLFLDIDGRCN